MKEDCQALLNRWSLVKEFNLPENSRVVVVGAYKGLAMELIEELYHPKDIIGYEPQSWAAEEARARLAEYPQHIVLQVGLGTKSEVLPMGEWHTDACSFINTGPNSREQGTGTVIDADISLGLLFAPPERIDLLLMNIEGYEFVLLPYLREKGWLDRIDRLAVQWHLGLGDQDASMNTVNNEARKLVGDGFEIKVDERPAWIYFERDL